MAKKSAGILVYRFRNGSPEVFLVHPGGPFYARKDLGVWTIPKGEFAEEDPEVAARREFTEETGITIRGEIEYLGQNKQKSGKLVFCFCVEEDIDISDLQSNVFELEWPPKSGKKQEFPEIDRGQWFPVTAAPEKVHRDQVVFLDALLEKLKQAGIFFNHEAIKKY